MSRWSLRVAPAAERTLGRLPDKVAVAVVEFITGPLLDVPERVGKPLQRELSGYRSARCGAYRIIYRLVQAEGSVRVLRIEHRATVYRAR